MKIKIDTETGELLPTEVMVKADKAPAITIDIEDVAVFHTSPELLVDKIRQQAGFAVFDVSTKKGRDECKSHAANIIRCITPACEASKALAETAKKVVKQDLEFRKTFESGVREIAEFHRRPLTEWEDEQKRIEEAAKLAEEKRLADEQYLKDWQDAIDFDELFTLRREKEAAEAEKQRLIVEADIANKRAWAKEHADGYQFLFADMSSLVLKDFDEFKEIVLKRVAHHQEQEALKLAKERDRIREEELAKLKQPEPQKPVIPQPATHAKLNEKEETLYGFSVNSVIEEVMKLGVNEQIAKALIIWTAEQVK